jgi:hypothetical protein
MKTIEEIYKAYIGDGQMGVDFEKKHIIKAMQAYASEQTEKYKELIDVMDKLYEVSCDTLYELEIDPTEEMGKLYIKIQLLKTELGL